MLRNKINQSTGPGANTIGKAAAVFTAVTIASLIVMCLKTISSLPTLLEFHE